jgi:hypothetical protein
MAVVHVEKAGALRVDANAVHVVTFLLFTNTTYHKQVELEDRYYLRV